jgi:deoxyadenosine/deoxycytidine kinase
MSSLIYVEGIIGAGKTTFVQNISKTLTNIKTITEPVESWQRDGILDKFYKDMKRWALSFQLRIIHDKTEVLNNLPQHENDIYIVERSIYSDSCFTNTLHDSNLLDPFDFKLSNDVRKTYEERMKIQPSLIIYLRTPLETCMERVKSRNRKEEQDLTSEYQETLLSHHDTLFNKSHMITCNGVKVPIIILEDNEVTPELVKKINYVLQDTEDLMYTYVGS